MFTILYHKVDIIYGVEDKLREDKKGYISQFVLSSMSNFSYVALD